jgi:hypothetical protein
MELAPGLLRWIGENLCTLELRDLKHSVLRIVLELTRRNVGEAWRKIRNEQLRDLYWSPNIIRGLELGRM